MAAQVLVAWPPLAKVDGADDLGEVGRQEGVPAVWVGVGCRLVHVGVRLG